jgi:hypothetical protein
VVSTRHLADCSGRSQDDMGIGKTCENRTLRARVLVPVVCHCFWSSAFFRPRVLSASARTAYHRQNSFSDRADGLPGHQIPDIPLPGLTDSGILFVVGSDAAPSLSVLGSIQAVVVCLWHASRRRLKRAAVPNRDVSAARQATAKSFCMSATWSGNVAAYRRATYPSILSAPASVIPETNAKRTRFLRGYT